MKRRYSLKGRRQFGRLYRQGESWSGARLRIRYLRRPDELPRFAVSAPRACGNAVRRNRLRRVIREVLRQTLALWPPGLYHLRIPPSTRTIRFAEAHAELADFRRALDA